ncbi:MAG TPA: hypothetical protein VK427_20575 [Kofleriaceae bacterium]|nr:hypothetical protein [Kofleriaceae bacterium]
MANEPRENQSPKRGADRTAEAGKSDERAEEYLREQTKTETEQRPYLDTEGGD